MEFNTTPTRYGGRDGERGAGGKFKKPSARKPPATPYDRPPLNQSGRTSWLSKLVDPAYRIISGSANRILPSFISNAIAGNPPPLEQIDGELDNEDPATTQDVGNDNKCTSSYVISRTTEGNKDDPSMEKLNEIPEAEKLGEEKPKNSSSTEGKEEDPSTGKANVISEAEKLEEEKPKNSSDSVEISRIEQLMQGKSFSRDEITRLTKILNSRVDEEKKLASRTAEGDIGRFHLAHETPRRPNDRKRDETDFAMPGTSTPLPQTNVRDEVGASPIDIARAYMGSRRLSKGNDSYGFVSKVEQAPQNRFHPPPSPKSSTCWPAAMVQDQHGHFTPLNQRGYGLVEFPRTPYSRTLLPKSRDRTQSQVGSRWLDPSTKPFQQSQSSIYSQEKTRTDLPLPSYGSVGPIRRIRNKFGSESRPRKSIFLNSPNASSPLEKVGASKLFLPAAGKNLEVGQTSGVEKYQSADHRVVRSEEAIPLISSSNDTVRKILEQLDRHKPTPAEKAAELKLASEWKKYPGKEISDSTPNDKMKSSHLGEFGIRMNNGLAAAQSSKEGDNETVNRVEIPQEQTTRETDTGMDASAKAASIANVFVTTAKANTVLPFTSKAADSQVKSFFSGSHTPSLHKDSIRTDDGQKDKGSTSQWPSFHNQSNGQNAATLSNSTGFQLPRNAPGQASSAKPNLPSIFVNKPNPRNATSPDNGFGFSFPVAASSGALSEPPTPSMPSPAAGVLSQPVDASTSPVYTFGTGKSAECLIFSFPSTSNASVPVDASDLKFSFGTDRTSRLSFGAIGKTTC
ncbi:nuclear pore complex protein NUP1-like isoform X2 [Solanum stenotomum]|uniref:nuclear pore complex protein NUP1-like isoform X2 n=1 Tax=Solanum stenotomum TaxID=172797 RepID=UPI0020D0D976|nr:nuclear pore complex protein NUP1-like isoform X2 [Solanum stenotomum]